MAFLSSDDLEGLREDFNSLLSLTCLIKRRNQDATTNLRSGSYATVVSTICSVLPGSTGHRDGQFAGADGSADRAARTIPLPYDTDVKWGDLIEVNNLDYKVVDRDIPLDRSNLIGLEIAAQLEGAEEPQP